MILTRIITCILLVSSCSLLSLAQIKVSFESELRRLMDIHVLPQYIEGTIVKQISSYDTTGGNDDGFNGYYSYIRKEPSGGLVIFEAKEQGVIERIWTPTPTQDTLDFYFDNNSKPGFSIRFCDLFNNRIFPFVKPIADQKVGGNYSYVPIPYRKGCKIVFRGEKILFHQIQYREYDERYSVQSFDIATVSNHASLINKIRNIWNNDDRSIYNFYPGGFHVLRKNIRLSPGNTASLAHLHKGGRILGIELSPSHVFEGLFKQIDLKISWDDEKAPAVYVPLADFFGFAYGVRSMKSLLLGANDAKLYCYIPMPFDKKASIELVYRKRDVDTEILDLSVVVYYTDERRNVLKEGRFYCYWKNENPPLGKPYVFLSGNGKGHYIGTLLQGQATDFTHFTEYFEGDDYTEIDGKMTMHGTGSEDYFNGGWYAQPGGWVERLGSPLSGCLEYSLPLGRTGGYRFFLLDKMPFKKSILHTIEHGPEQNNRAVNYISAALYYADHPVTTINLPANESTKIYTPDTLTFYTRLMRHLTYNGSLIFRNEKAQLVGSENASLNINALEIPKGRYELYLHIEKSEVESIEIKIADASNVQNWHNVRFNKDRLPANILIGRVDISVPSIPINILFKCKNANPGLVFDRVALYKIDN